MIDPICANECWSTGRLRSLVYCGSGSYSRLQAGKLRQTMMTAMTTMTTIITMTKITQVVGPAAACEPLQAACDCEVRQDR